MQETTATGTGDWTFMLGTDYQLPEGTFADLAGTEVVECSRTEVYIEQ